MRDVAVIGPYASLKLEERAEFETFLKNVEPCAFARIIMHRACVERSHVFHAADITSTHRRVKW